MQKLNENEIQERMREINSTWLIENDFISKEFLFKDFVHAALESTIFNFRKLNPIPKAFGS